jgi:hypothetical protein
VPSGSKAAQALPSPPNSREVKGGESANEIPAEISESGTGPSLITARLVVSTPLLSVAVWGAVGSCAMRKGP